MYMNVYDVYIYIYACMYNSILMYIHVYSIIFLYDTFVHRTWLFLFLNPGERSCNITWPSPASRAETEVEPQISDQRQGVPCPDGLQSGQKNWAVMVATVTIPVFIHFGKVPNLNFNSRGAWQWAICNMSGSNATFQRILSPCWVLTLDLGLQNFKQQPFDIAKSIMIQDLAGKNQRPEFHPFLWVILCLSVYIYIYKFNSHILVYSSLNCVGHHWPTANVRIGPADPQATLSRNPRLSDFKSVKSSHSWAKLSERKVAVFNLYRTNINVFWPNPQKTKKNGLPQTGQSF